MFANKMRSLLVFALVVVGALVFADDLWFTSGHLQLPSSNGSFIEGSESQFNDYANAFTAFYCKVTKEEYETYHGRAAQIYADWKKGEFDREEDFDWREYEYVSCDYDSIHHWNVAEYWYDDVGNIGANTTVYGLAVYDIVVDGREYYIAAVAKAEKKDSPVISAGEYMLIATKAGCWTPVVPSEPLTISCVGLAVTSGVVTATFSISDTSRYGEIISNGMATVTVATDLAGTDRHGLSASATTDASSGTFTVVFPVPSNTSRLFIFGVQ